MFEPGKMYRLTEPGKKYQVGSFYRYRLIPQVTCATVCDFCGNEIKKVTIKTLQISVLIFDHWL